MEHGPIFDVDKVEFMVDGTWCSTDILVRAGEWFGRFRLDKEIEICQIIETEEK